jgi:hypothetical protein
MKPTFTSGSKEANRSHRAIHGCTVCGLLQPPCFGATSNFKIQIRKLKNIYTMLTTNNAFRTKEGAITRSLTTWWQSLWQKWRRQWQYLLLLRRLRRSTESLLGQLVCWDEVHNIEIQKTKKNNKIINSMTQLLFCQAISALAAFVILFKVQKQKNKNIFYALLSFSFMHSFVRSF